MIYFKQRNDVICIVKLHREYLSKARIAPTMFVASFLYTQFYGIKGGGGSERPPPIIFERQILPQQTIYRWKGNLTVSTIHFKYWKKCFDFATL